ncbi:SAVED domain-containing protein [Herpetosiphon gulosus]|uniref:SMODS-associated and fused to various effectors domain-containing protein n=1 Tax=Herpetosiphon gulosus TaxID=1973496 RepID=A0ABP9X6R3_9CHLR
MISLKTLQEERAMYLKHFALLSKQIASAGGDMRANTKNIIQRDEIREKIDELDKQIQELINTQNKIVQSAEGHPSFCLAIDANPLLDGLALHLQLRGLRITRIRERSSFQAKTPFPVAAAIMYCESLDSGYAAQRPYHEYLEQSTNHLLYLIGGSYPADAMITTFGTRLGQTRMLDNALAPAQLAKIVLATVLGPILQSRDAATSLAIDIFSYERAEYAQPALLCIDTRKLGFEPADWAALMQAFYDLREVLNASAAKRLAVRPMNSRLSVAMAFGAVFSSSANFEVRVAYERRGQTSVDAQTLEWWRNHNNPNPESLPIIELPIISEVNQEAVVGLSITRDVKIAVQAYFGSQQPPQLLFFGYSVLEPGINAVPTGDEGRAASAIANQFGHLLRTHRDRMLRRTWDFFYALPVSLAVLVGQELNACTPIQCYEFMNDRNPAEYIPSCLIKQN